MFYTCVKSLAGINTHSCNDSVPRPCIFILFFTIPCFTLLLTYTFFSYLLDTSFLKEWNTSDTACVKDLFLSVQT